MAGSIQLRLTLAAAIAIAAVATGGYFVLHSAERRDASVDAAQSRPSARVGPKTTEPSRPESATPDSLAAERTAELASEWNDGEHDVIGPVVEGTIVVTDRDGEKHVEQDGSFVPDFIDGADADSGPDGGESSNAERPARRPVAVKGGRVRFDARGATAMMLEELELGGHAAVVDGGVDLSTGRPLEITARWIDDVLLHVVDATTKEELPGVRVCFGGRFVAPAEHPGLAGPPCVLIDVANSPLHLTRATSMDRIVMDGAIWIGARDRAWKRETIDFERDREREVALGPSGALTVVLTEPPGSPPFDPHAPPHVRLRHPGHETGDPICDFAAEVGEFALDGLAPGDVVAAVEVGDSQIAPMVLSRAEVSIRAGETAHATLCLDPSRAPKPTTLAGIVYVPGAWGPTPMQLELVAIEQRGGASDDQRCQTSISRDVLDDRSGWHKWSLRRVLPGSYRLLVRRAGFETPIEVAEGGRDDVTITLQDPAVLQVRVVDEDSLQDVEVGELTWVPWATENHNPAPLTTLGFDRATHRFVAAVVPGTGLVVGANLGRGRAEERFTVAAGINELVVHSQPACGVLLTVAQKANDRISVEVTWSATGSPGGDDAGFAWVSGNEAGHRIELPEPGHYRFTCLSRANSQEIHFEVDVAKGEFVEKRITLDR